MIVIGSLAVHRDDAAEEQAGGVGEYGRTARRDAILSEKADDARQKAVDLVGSAQLGEVVAEQVSGEVGEFAVVEFELGVLKAEGEPGDLR